MKNIYLIGTMVVISACSSTNSPPAAVTSNATPSSAIQAFRDICLKTAPDLANAASAAKAHGIADVTDVGFMVMGLTADKNMSIQIKASQECVVTTPSQQDDSLTRQVLDAAHEFSSTPVGKTSPVKLTLGGQVFILAHDRSGGEAYVLLKAKD